LRPDAPQPQTKPEADPYAIVHSMQGTVPDGLPSTSPGDSLVVTADLRRMFDYYFAAQGEKTLPMIRAAIEAELDKTLKPKAAAAAKDLLARYLAYKRALVDVEQNAQANANSGTGLHARYDAMQQVRARYFSQAENQALFGFEDSYDLDAIKRLEISQDTTLSAADKQAKLAALDQAMPAKLKEEKEAPYVVIRLEEKAATMRAAGASDDDVYRMRAADASPEAAARLAQVDREQAEWKSRIAAYLADRQSLLQAVQGTQGTDQQASLQQLRDHYFSPAEQRRLPAYEKSAGKL
jgi:lipase chaperone LimK